MVRDIQSVRHPLNPMNLSEVSAIRRFGFEMQSKIRRDGLRDWRPDHPFLSKAVPQAFGLHRVAHDSVAVHDVLPAHRDLEDVSATVYYAEPMFVVGTRDVGDSDIKGAISVAVATESFGLAADAINPACPLLERCGVPREVVMDDVAALAVKIDAFLADCSDDEDLRNQRRVEAHE